MEGRFQKYTEKYKNMSLAAKAALWFTLANFLVKGISFITVPLFAKYLSPSEYGKYSIYQTYQGILINFATFEMYSGAYIRGLLRYKKDEDFFTWSEQALSTLLTVIVFVITIPFIEILINQTETNRVIIVFTYLYFVLFPAYECWVNRKRFTYEYKPVVLSTIIYTISSTIVPLLAVLKISRISNIRIFFMLLAQIIFCLPFYIKNIHINTLIKGNTKVKEQWKFLILFQAPSVVHALSYIILSSMDRIMIGNMVGKAEAGIYSIATTLANVIAIFSISANQVLKPWRYQKMEKGDYKAIKTNSTSLLIAFGSFIIIWILVAPEALKILFSSDYTNAVWAIPPISMSVFFIFLYSMFVDIEEFFYKTKYSMYATTICAILNIVLNYFGIIIWGYIACAYTTLICYILLAVLHCMWANKAAKINNILLTDIFDLKKILIFSLLLVAIEAVITMLYTNMYARYGVTVVLTVAILVNFKKIYHQFKEIKNS